MTAHILGILIVRGDFPDCVTFCNYEKLLVWNYSQASKTTIDASIIFRIVGNLGTFPPNIFASLCDRFRTLIRTQIPKYENSIRNLGLNECNNVGVMLVTELQA